MKAYQKLIREAEEIKGDNLLFSQMSRKTPLKQTVVRQVTVAFATPYILRYEWLHCMPGFSEFAFAHFFGYECGGVVVLGHTTGSNVAFTRRFPNDKVIQLQRGVNLWWTPKNSASYFITKIIKWLRLNTEYTIITATADEEAGEIGTIYQALNWKYIGFEKHGHPVFIINGKEIHPKTLYDLHGTSAVETIKKIYKDKVTIKPRQFKHRYVYPINSKTHIDELPYPKRKLYVTK